MRRAEDGSGSGVRVPRIAPDWTPAHSALNPVEGFLLSRIDGHTGWEQLRHIGGMPPEEVDACLERWVEEGVVVIAGAGEEIASPSAAGAPPKAEEGAVDPDLEISEELQRRILEFEASLDVPYHRLLGVDRKADAKEIKRAYFRLSKEFHPDRYYRREIGHFGARLDRIFKRVVEAYELLSDPATRAEIERSLAHMPEPEPEEPAAPAPDAPPPSREESRRAMLERLRRQFRIPDAILAERRLKARQFSEAARVAIHREQWLEAAASARLAIAFDPWNREYKQSFAEISSRVQEQRAARLLEQGEAAMDSHAQHEALRLYEEVLAYRPRDPEVNHRAARLCIDLGHLEQAREYAESACDACPDRAEYHHTLGRVFRREGMRLKAMRAFEKALELDRGHTEAMKDLSALRRPGRRQADETGGT